jgi:hypothetical protein
MRRSGALIIVGRSALHLILALLMLAGCSRASDLPVRLAQPSNPLRAANIAHAEEWLLAHVERGTLTTSKVDAPVAIVAWKDPSLAPELPDQLAGYAITDTLWAAMALRLNHAPESDELMNTLRRLGVTGNGLHEVLWTRLPEMRHRIIDADPVHGTSLGIARLPDGRSVDVRTFNWRADPAFTRGHPALFAEHAVYQAFFEYWNGDVDAAQARIRRILRPDLSHLGEQQILWDHERGILVDRYTFADWQDFRAGRRMSCANYTFKLALVVYAARLMGMEQEFAPEIARLTERVWEAQLPTGGLAHSAEVYPNGESVPGIHATGEATAIGILAAIIQPALAQ